MAQLVTTADTPAPDQFDHWRHLVSNNFVPLEASTKQHGFRGRLRGEDLGRIRVYEATADPHIVRRTNRMIALGNVPFYKLGLQLHGQCVLSQDGRQIPLWPGDFAIYDTTRPYTLSFDDVSSTLVLMFPQDMLCLPAQHLAGLTATRFTGGAGVSGIVSSFLVQLARNLADPDVRGSVRLARNVVDLLGTALADRIDFPDVPTETARNALVVKIKAFIDGHLRDASLTPHDVAAANHISTRYLHKLFSDCGVTVSDWTRKRRLEQCGHDLADPANQAVPIGAIGARWGLVDASYFSRAFKAQYGVTPSDYRQRALG